MSEQIIKPNDFNQMQVNILVVSAVRALVRKGILQKEDITFELGQQGMPAEWAFKIFQYISEMPVDP